VLKWNVMIYFLLQLLGIYFRSPIWSNNVQHQKTCSMNRASFTQSALGAFQAVQVLQIPREKGVPQPNGRDLPRGVPWPMAHHGTGTGTAVEWDPLRSLFCLILAPQKSRVLFVSNFLVYVTVINKHIKTHARDFSTLNFGHHPGNHS